MGNHHSSVLELHSPAEPAEPTLSRSRSIKSDANAIVRKASDDIVWHTRTSDEPVKFPRTVPYDGSDPLGSGLHGADSPQWGWYTHHSTPPTPELYYKRSNKTNSGKSSSVDTVRTENSDSSSSAETHLMSIPQPNPVFKILQNKYKTNPTVWNMPS